MATLMQLLAQCEERRAAARAGSKTPVHHIERNRKSKLPPVIVECRFRGESLRVETCPTCSGNVKVKVFECNQFGECTLTKPIGDIACCNARGKVCDKRESVKAAAVGVVTAPRLKPTLDKCLQSLREAGWPEVRVFDDGGCSGIETATVRVPPAGSWGNWWSSFQELVQRNPAADYYLMLEDDTVLSRGARMYVESLDLLDTECVLSLYCSARYDFETTTLYETGSVLCGACALLITRTAAERLAASGLGLSHRRKVGDKNDETDQAVGGWCEENNIPLWIHAPSLAQHIGETSTLGHREKPSRNFIADANNGSADRLINVGLFGWNTASGLGTLNRAFAKYMQPVRWLVPVHPMFAGLPDLDDVPTTHTTRPVTDFTYTDFIIGLDAVVFFEQPAVLQRQDALTLAKNRGVAIVCVPMIEWLDDAGQSGIGDWPSLVDLFLCPTKDCYDAMGPLQSKSLYFPWPIDLEEIEYRQRLKCRRFVFHHGTGGCWDRKGGQIVAEAARLTPDIPLTVYSQVADGIAADKSSAVEWPSHVEVIGQVASQRELYQRGDVCIQPSRLEGLGLQLLECQAAGMPLVTTDGAPMNEYSPYRLINCTTHQDRVHRDVNRYDADPAHLAQIMTELIGVDISDASLAARAFAETRDWAAAKKRITAAIHSAVGAKS